MTTEHDKLEAKLKAQSEFNRYEAKYLIHPALIPKIREFIEPFCVDDPHGHGVYPEYVITTLQLDSYNLDLHQAKENEAVNRFKMRIRTYDSPGSPYFLEIKRKIKGSIAKSRVMIPHDQYGEKLFSDHRGVTFRSESERCSFLDFLRLRDQLGAKPIVFIRYHRESYMGANEAYSRLTIDRNLCYRRTTSYDFPKEGDRFRSMDSARALNRPFSGVILELKTHQDVPSWMVELTERLGLTRNGFCKYSTAMNQEALFYSHV